MSSASERQQQAARPDRSTWLSANAGSGKTRVLTERVARLLLDGAPPQNILCLTYTKAAASEMQNRLFRTLGEWAMKGDTELREALDGIAAPEAIELDTARRLFATAIETPGGLKIQTIHSYCAALLRRFPLEAGIAADFREMEDSDQKELMREAARDFAEGPEAAGLGGVVTADQLEDFLGAIVRLSARFRRDWDEAAVRAELGLGADDDRDAILRSVFLGGEEALLETVAGAMGRGSPTDGKKADALRALDWSGGPSLGVFDAFREIFFTAGSGYAQPAARLMTNGVGEALGTQFDAFLDLIERVREAVVALLKINALNDAKAIHTYGAAFIARYEALKAERGALDFDDLITKTDALLNSGMAQWVAFRLDGEIDHILVDEAQDTSPAQWRVIEALAAELVAGKGARNMDRTIFVVGDKKQSIYSFQGADPAEFDRMRDIFRDRLKTHAPLQTSDLIHSFRSAPTILSLVDRVFAVNGESALGHASKHIAFDADRPGRVDLWPLVEKEEKPEDPAFGEPVDRLAPNHPAIRLALALAAEARRMCEVEMLPDGEGGWRRVEPGDIMILVQRRSTLFHHIIRACKTEGLPIAGADVFDLGKDLAVKDLLSLLAFLSLIEDDLALAEVLRSPLFGLSEDDLFDLAAGRGGKTLWQRLGEERAHHPRAYAVLTELLADADYLRPYELLERILTRYEGRARLLGRLGDEARDGIDELLNLALRYESHGPPNLTRFVQWARREAAQVKRGMDGSKSQVRVMTVHGAKGLESPIVILPDTVFSSSGRRSPFLTPLGSAVFPTGSKATRVEAVEVAHAARQAAEDNERQRLLYVAMTRAEHWLILCGTQMDSIREGSWHPLVQEAMPGIADVLETPVGPGLRHASGGWADVCEPRSMEQTEHARHLPDWIANGAPTPRAEADIISPSKMPGDKWLKADEAAPDATDYGDLVHGLLEAGPEARGRLSEIAAWLKPAMALERREAAVAEAARVLDDSTFSNLFDAKVHAELPFSAPLGDRIIRGQIDRLIVEDDRVLIVDFKSNRTVPTKVADTPPGILEQLGAYAFAAAHLFPGKEIETAILWTATPEIQAIPHDIVMEAFHRATTS